MHEFRQFFLLFYKDWILLKRNKLWAIFEIILPCLIMFPIGTMILAKSGNYNTLHPTTVFPPFLISELFGRQIIDGYWCGNRDSLRFGYTSLYPEKINDVRDVMSRFIERFRNSTVRITVVEFDNESDMMNELEKDLKGQNFENKCNIHNYIGGVVFDEIDKLGNILKYRIAISDGRSKYDWKLEQNQRFPYGGHREKFHIPSEPPYYYSGFLHLQHAVETSFIEFINGKRLENYPIIFKPLSEAHSIDGNVQLFIGYFSLLFPFIALFNVMHISQQISSENENVKPYLSAMGLSTPMFYLNHILVGLAKFMPAIFITLITVGVELQYTAPSVFFITMFFFALGALIFGALFGALFKKPIKAVLFSWALSIILAYYQKPDGDQIIKSFFYGLNINGAFSLAVSAISNNMEMERFLGILNVFDDSLLYFSMGFAIFMMIFDIFWMTGLILLVDKYRDNYSIRNFVENIREKLGKSKNRTQNMEIVRMSELEKLEESFEIDPARSSAKSGVSVRNLVKIWPETGEKAVDGLSFEAKKGQISVLLGHNGAGKSTTFQSIVGAIKPSKGEIKVGNRNRVGLCPQNNPIYDKLTVEEHLWLIYGFRGGKLSVLKFEEDMNKLLMDIKMMEKKNELAMNLSGGMKRKLCVCMALIGSSEVVLLDEPTAGMDPGARKDVQDLLEREKQNRTILLTTHYMDEAERLGDWILIMSHGKLVSSGTTKFLKQKYGTGYLLTVVLDVYSDKENLCQILENICKFYIPDAKLGKKHGQQVEIVLPEHRKTDFPFLFRALENAQEGRIDSKLPNSVRKSISSLKISSFGLSLNTLEQVFINIESIQSGNEPESGCQKNLQEKFKKLREDVPQKPECSKLLSQVLAIFRKKFIYSRRNWSNILSQIIIPIFLLSILAYMTRYNGRKSEGEKIFEFSESGKSRYLWMYPAKSQSEDHDKIHKILLRNPGKFEALNYYGSENLEKVIEEIRGILPTPEFGFIQNYTLFDLRNYHILPKLVTLQNQARFMINSAGKFGNQEIVIECGIKVYSSNNIAGITTHFWAKILFAPIILLIFTMLTSSFVMFLVEERVSKFAHQQFLTGISHGVFYTTSMIFDFALYFGICAVFVGIVVIFELALVNFWVVVIFWFLYFFSTLPFIYIISQFLNSPEKANILLITWQIIISTLAFFFLYFIIPPIVFTLHLDLSKAETFRKIFRFLLPAYTFGTSIIYASTKFDKSGWQLFEMEELGENAVFLLVFGIACLTVFVALQFRVVKEKLANFSFSRKPNLIYEKCEGIQQKPFENPVLVIKDLSKNYGKLRALDSLNLEIAENECFGLLGTNGAGKTTTFNILTGQEFATSGEATLGGKDVTERVAIGYCPQFDALLLDLTGREILEILGQMHGFKKYQEKAELVLECVGMRQNADKLCRYYSGGQKRKISVGVALLSPTQMIILDEPTAGIDPKARREIWELLIWTRQNSNSALMLTSHSMDECEALCSRIAVLNRGKLIAIGTSQELKSLYGNSYTMTLTLNSEQNRENLVADVKSIIPAAILKTSQTNKTSNLVWHIPKKSNDKWSEKFEMVQNLARHLNVNDFILSQSSLEETFLQLSNSNKSNV
ncbi:unnamed protein product [Caenorhabditis angaria]|uniref:ABC transporter domain-containing protein n=1 Tax=Caenorhabditis angaria TaxID=860376 RepID=A0A9P1N2C1_9PELO|nr:unnamed protein product [Caenorhabditis angaria]